MKHPTPADLLRQEADLIDAGAKLQEQSLELLKAEMRALAALIPGMTPTTPAASEAETDAKTEAGFDNMPV